MLICGKQKGWWWYVLGAGGDVVCKVASTGALNFMPIVQFVQYFSNIQFPFPVSSPFMSILIL